MDNALFPFDGPDRADWEALFQIARERGLEVIDVDRTEVPAWLLKLVPKSLAWTWFVLPLGVTEDAIKLIVADPDNVRLIDVLRRRLGREIETAITLLPNLVHAIERHYGTWQPGEFADEPEGWDFMWIRRTYTPEQLARIARDRGLDVIDVSRLEVPLPILALVPGSVAWKYEVLPLCETDTGLRIIVFDPDDSETIEELQFILGCTISIAVALRDDLIAAIERHYGPMPLE